MKVIVFLLLIGCLQCPGQCEENRAPQSKETQQKVFSALAAKVNDVKLSPDARAKAFEEIIADCFKPGMTVDEFGKEWAALTGVEVVDLISNLAISGGVNADGSGTLSFKVDDDKRDWLMGLRVKIRGTRVSFNIWIGVRAGFIPPNADSSAKEVLKGRRPEILDSATIVGVAGVRL